VRIIVPEEEAIARHQLSKHDPSETYNCNNRTVGSGVFCAVHAEAKY
jgi:hypothetical protein